MSGSPRAKHGTQDLFCRLPAALRLPTSHQELGNYTSRLILSFLRFLARWPGWYGIAALPCFSASAIIRRHSLWSPLTGHLCRISPQRTGRRSGISTSMSICVLTSGRQLPVLPFVAVLPSKTAITMRNHGDVLELRQRSLCVYPRWATSLRGARGPVPHERCDLSALIVGCIVRAAYRGERCEKMKSTAPRYGAGGKRHK